MNIGIICYPSFGGSGVLATELGLEMAYLGHTIHFITHRQPARLPDTHFLPNVFFHEVRMFAYPLFDFVPYESLFVSRLLDVVNNYKIDLLHLHYAIPFASIAYMLRRILQSSGRDIPVVTTLHGTDITLLSRDKTFAPVVAFSIEQSTAVTAVSQYLKKETQTLFSLNKEIRVIYNFIDLKRYAAEHKELVQRRKKALAPFGEKIITHISNFRKVKRVEDVVRIFLKISEKESVKLLMVGDGPERVRIEEMCRGCLKDKQILLLGKVANIEEILALSDLFLLPSESESFGLSALEAMAAGAPVITTNVGGLSEVNIHGVSGYLAALGDVDTMAHYALAVLKNPDLHAQLSAGARKRAKAFAKEKIIPQYLSLYESLL